MRKMNFESYFLNLVELGLYLETPPYNQVEGTSLLTFTQSVLQLPFV